MVGAFRLSSEQLSSQDHYDFGMRAVNTVISAAGLNKRDFPDAPEASRDGAAWGAPPRTRREGRTASNPIGAACRGGGGGRAMRALECGGGGSGGGHQAAPLGCSASSHPAVIGKLGTRSQPQLACQQLPAAKTSIALL
eukprot:gene13211-biopygen9332